MSLYNALFGENPFSGILLKLLGLEKEHFYRYRDCYLVRDEDEDKEMIAVHTRGGGGNRQDNDTDVDGHSHYLFDEDDSFDPTYATYYFAIPDSGQQVLDTIRHTEGLKRSPEESWEKLFRALEKGDRSDPLVQHAVEVGKQIFADIAKQAQEKEKGKIAVIDV